MSERSARATLTRGEDGRVTMQWDDPDQVGWAQASREWLQTAVDTHNTLSDARDWIASAQSALDHAEMVAALLVDTICEQEAELRQPFGWREGQDTAFWHARWMEAAEAREGNYRRYVEALHLIDDLVEQIERLRRIVWGLVTDADHVEQDRDNAIAERDAAHQEVAELREQIAQEIEDRLDYVRGSEASAASTKFWANDA